MSFGILLAGLAALIAIGATGPLLKPFAGDAHNLMRMLLGESAEAFGDLADRYRSELLVHCYRMLGTIDEAEDAVQDTFARAWQGRQTFRRSISFRAWLYRIATNVCLNAIARRKRDPVEIGPCPDYLLTG